MFALFVRDLMLFVVRDWRETESEMERDSKMGEPYLVGTCDVLA